MTSFSLFRFSVEVVTVIEAVAPEDFVAVSVVMSVAVVALQFNHCLSPIMEERRNVSHY